MSPISTEYKLQLDSIFIRLSAFTCLRGVYLYPLSIYSVIAIFNRFPALKYIFVGILKDNYKNFTVLNKTLNKK